MYLLRSDAYMQYFILSLKYFGNVEMDYELLLELVETAALIKSLPYHQQVYNITLSTTRFN